MTRVSLQRLRLANFKGARELLVEPAGGDLTVRGDNATGKTTFADAYSWLLTGRDSLGSAKFEIKTLEGGSPIRGLNHEVEGTFIIEGGRPMTLERVYREVWTSRRGSATKEMTGHTTDFKVDGVPVQEKDFMARVAAIAPSETWRRLSDPYYFAEGMPWQDRRRIIVEVCGDVADDDVFASSTELAALPAALDGRTVDDARKVWQAQKRELAERLSQIPARIDEASRLAGQDEVSVAALKEKVERLRVESTEIERRIADARATGGAAELRAALAKAKARLAEIEDAHRRKAEDAFHAALLAARSARADLTAAISDRDRAERLLSEQRAECERLTAAVQAKREEYNGLRRKEFVPPQVSAACAACGQPLPQEKVEAAAEAAFAAFNQSRSARLEALQSEGRAMRDRLDNAEAQVASLEAELAKRESDLVEAERAWREAEAAASAAQSADWMDAATKDPDYVAAAAEVARLQSAAEEQGDSFETTELEAQRLRVAEELADASRRLAAAEQAAQATKRVEQLAAEQRQIGAELETVEHRLWLTEEFVRRKVALLTGRINQRFTLVSFVLFRDLVNGGIEECCEVAVDGVPFASLNHGTRLNAGLEIIDVLASHYGVAVPVVIDNAESVTQIRPTIGQQLRLVVDAAHKTLAFEASQASPTAA
jgi:hypothetical protein